MKPSRQFTVLAGAIFCAAVFSLYRMLEHLQPDRHVMSPGHGNLENPPLSLLQEKVERLERLLAANNHAVARLRDALLRPQEGGANRSSYSSSRPVHPAPLREELCVGSPHQPAKEDGEGAVQLLDIYKILDFDNPDGGVWKQGFDISYRGDEWDQEPLEVFVVPHSHNDPGWLKTFTDYYRDQTQHILNNMVVKLSEDKRRKMIWSEISYFAKWWENLDDQKRDAVKRLLQNGQLEITTGGWVMADEANSHYFALLDQLIEGHQWLERNLGVKPSTGWAVDPFGHSPSMAYLLKRAGLANMLIQRVHYAVKKHFATKKTLEFKWRQNWDPTSSTDILCHMMPFYSYDIPHTCGPDPKVCCQFDFLRLPGGRVNCPWRVPPRPITDENVEERAHLLLDQYRKKSMLFRSNVMLAPLGDDFRYTEAKEWDEQFNNYQKLFDYFNSHPELHVKAQFGTVSDYFSALRKHLPVEAVVPSNNQALLTGVELPTLRGDFFTYADRDDHYWSGYFTSRPFYKRLDRTLESHLRAAEILYSLALAEIRLDGGNRGDFPATECYRLLTAARQNLGLFQHHDAVTGTAKDRVVQDYGTRLLHSILNLKEVLLNSAHWLVLQDKTTYQHDPSKAFLHMEEVQPSQDALPVKTVLKIGTEPRSLVVYNPTGQLRSSVVSVHVDMPSIRVIAMETGRQIPAQLSAVWEKPMQASKEAFQLSFIAQVPPFALTIYHLIGGPEGATPRSEYTFLRQDWLEGPPVDAGHFKVSRPVGAEAATPLSLRNAHVQIWSSASSGLLEKVRLLDDGLERHVQVKFFWYGTTSNRDKSGAYLFLPDGEAKPYTPSQPSLVRVTRGPIFSDITSIFQHVTHVTRLYHVDGVEGASVQLSNLVDIRLEVNRELVMRLVSDVASDNRFYSDLNGFQIQPRRTMAKLPLQANFYPMTSMAYLQDLNSRLTLHTAQSLGVASLKSGHLEVILDRRLNQDDNRGLGQGVTDNKLTASSFSLLLERRRGGGEEKDAKHSPVSYPSLLSHLSSLLLSHPPFIMATSPDHAPAGLLSSYRPLADTLPCDLHLVNLRTLQAQDGGSPSHSSALILHRKGFDCDVNTQTNLHCHASQGQLDLDGLFSSLRFHDVWPVSLTLMHADNGGNNSPGDQSKLGPRNRIQLDPMEIKTFRVELR
ncbi:alpha-mannosidase 2 isoform 1-T2 [Polymixia lowei]